MKRAGIVAIAGCGALLAAMTLHAQGTPPPPPALERLTVQSDGHPMAVWVRQPSSPRAVVLLVHGRTWSSRPDFDLQVPGLQRSVMAALARQGIAAYAVDLRGYGETPRDATRWLTPKRSAADVANVVLALAQRHPDLPPPVLVGWSRGAAISMLAAQTLLPPVSGLVLFGFAYDPQFRFESIEAPGEPAFMKNTRAGAISDFISPRVTPAAVVTAFAAQALRADPVLVDLKGDDEFNALDPSRITMPALILYGARDPSVTADTAAALGESLATSDVQIVELPGGDHAAQLEDTHDQWVSVVAAFVTRTTSRKQP